jgi:hypothetical protein
MSGSLTPMYGLGSGARRFGAIAISSPRTKLGSVGRIYSFMKQTQGAYVALNFIRTATFGNYIVRNGKLVLG